MFPILIYVAVAALTVLVPQAIQPTDALRDGHHRRLYWTGAVVAFGLVCAAGTIFLI